MDPRVDASSIRAVRRDHCDCIVPKTAKRSGATWVICRHLWCWLFLTNVLFAPHLKIISCCNTIAQANAELLGIIEDQSAKFQHNYKWKTFFQRGPSYKFLAPSISLLQFCGATPPPPVAGEPSRRWWGDYKGMGKVRVCDTPPWHTSLFQNRHGQIYYCPKSIRRNVLTAGALPEDDSLLSRMAPSWQPIYETASAGILGRPQDDSTLQLLRHQNAPGQPPPRPRCPPFVLDHSPPTTSPKASVQYGRMSALNPPNGAVSTLVVACRQ